MLLPDVPQFIYSPSAGHPGGFQVLTTVNIAAINICTQVFCVNRNFHLGKYQGVQLLECVVRVCLVF